MCHWALRYGGTDLRTDEIGGINLPGLHGGQIPANSLDRGRTTVYAPADFRERVVGMKAIQDAWNVVLAGNWNLAIFSPNWLSKNLFHSESITIEFPQREYC
ncbi:MAG: hypothetical protein HY268_27900 [Deltaproteobacteria bacterium]|nr:hypothetical protein [Deltaproteobacteria bacterium]